MGWQLSATKVNKIRAMRKAGNSINTISKSLGVGYGTVAKYAKNGASAEPDPTPAESAAPELSGEMILIRAIVNSRKLPDAQKLAVIQLLLH